MGLMNRHLCFICFSTVVAACSGGAEDSTDAGTSTSDAATVDALSVIDAQPPDAQRPDAALQVVDCDTIPSAPVSIATIPNAQGYHGLAITPDGKLLGSNSSALVATTYEGDTTLFSPNVGNGEQMRWLADGDLVMRTDSNELTRFDSAGGQTTLAPDAYDYAVVVGPDDAIYTSSFGSGRTRRVDPATGEKEVLWEGPFPGGNRPHSLGFSRDGKRLYLATVGNGDGVIYYVDLDKSNNFIGTPAVFATGVGNGWHDEVGVDACGNLYVPDWYTSSLYRISPSGVVTTLWAPANDAHYPHSLIWGTGEHGWRTDAIYMSQPYNFNTVVEVVIGVPSKEFQGTVLNAPPHL